MRLEKYLADLGIGTRKEIKKMIKDGRVEGDSEVDENSVVKLDGVILEYRKFRYFAIDKPAGIICATEDKKQKTVADFLGIKGMFPVGRLDKDTTGLLLMTNDGEFAHKVISPKYNIDKVYWARIDGDISEEDIRRFKEGINDYLPAKLERTAPGECLVTVHEGKFHQVKNMLKAVGKPVLELRRLSIGSLKLEDLNFSNGVCELSQHELDLIFS